MTGQIDLDAMSIEDLADLSDRVQKKLNDKIAAEKAELDKRQAALAKLTDRIAGKKAPRTSTRPKAEGAGKAAGSENAAAKAGAGGEAKPTAPAADGEGSGAQPGA